MVMVKCRNCGADVPSDEKARKCRACGTLFPFACAVCERKLRPPLADFPVERYFNEEGEPLCEDHYQRQCPECSRWFQADENPGFYLCPECTERRERQVEDGTIGRDAPDHSHEVTPEMEAEADTAARKAGCGSSAALLFFLGASLLNLLRMLWA